MPARPAPLAEGAAFRDSHEPLVLVFLPMRRILTDCDVKAPSVAADLHIWVCANEDLVTSNHDVVERIVPNLLGIVNSGYICVVHTSRSSKGSCCPVT